MTEGPSSPWLSRSIVFGATGSCFLARVKAGANPIGRQTSHAGRTTVTITSSHGEHARARAALTRIAGFFAHLRKTAEQLTALERWYRILSEALKKFLRGRKLEPPLQLPAGAASYG